MNIRSIALVMAYLFLVLSAFILLAFFVSLFFFAGENRSWPFFLTFALAAGSGLILRLLAGNRGRLGFTFREAIFVVSFGWFFIALFGALPYYISGAIPSLTDAYFESMSGFTTVGASILTNIEGLGKALLFWRSLTHFIGGGGIVVLTVAILPALSLEGVELFHRESSSPLGTRSLPSISEMARGIWLVYVFLNLLLIFLLVAGGMSWYDSICHAFGAISTGGFSPQNESIAAYSLEKYPNALYFEVVLAFFMFFASCNFVLHYSFLVHRQWNSYIKNTQFLFFAFLVTVFVLLISLNLVWYSVYPDFFTALRHASFSLVSLMTTTGFGTEDFSNWPTLSRLILIIGMFIGGSTGSTAGGMKVVRIHIALRQAIFELKRSIHPKRIFPFRLDQVTLPGETVRSVNTFLIIFLLSYLSGAMLLSLWENDFEAVVSGVIACMGVGPGTAQINGPYGNYAAFSVPSKWVLTYFMVLGRLELLPLFALFVPGLWKK